MTLCASKRGAQVVVVTSTNRGERLAELARRFDEGELQVVLDSLFPLAQVREALARSGSGHARGKIVLTA